MASRKRSISNDSDVSPLYKEWDEASCPICMDHPHNAVLLICTSYDKGCRPYICDTSYRHSNCLDQYRKLRAEKTENVSALSLTPAITSDDLTRDHVDLNAAGSSRAVSVGTPGGLEGSASNQTNLSSEAQGGTLWERLELDESNIQKLGSTSNLLCPLCRGTVLGWKNVEEARKYLNLKARSCSRESCSFFGNYRELRSHARRIHPSARPADVDPIRERAWQQLEHQREYNDIVSAIRAAIPGATVFGDYVIENTDRIPGEREIGGGDGRWLSTFFLFHMIGSMERGAELRGGRSRALARHRRMTGTSSRRRYLWGENLLGLRDDNDNEDVDEEPDLNIVSDIGEDVPDRRRRRRLARAPRDEDQP